LALQVGQHIAQAAGVLLGSLDESTGNLGFVTTAHHAVCNLFETVKDTHFHLSF